LTTRQVHGLCLVTYTCIYDRCQYDRWILQVCWTYSLCQNHSIYSSHYACLKILQKWFVKYFIKHSSIKEMWRAAITCSFYTSCCDTSVFEKVKLTRPICDWDSPNRREHRYPYIKSCVSIQSHETTSLVRTALLLFLNNFNCYVNILVKIYLFGDYVYS